MYDEDDTDGDSCCHDGGHKNIDDCCHDIDDRSHDNVDDCCHDNKNKEDVC